MKNRILGCLLLSLVVAVTPPLCAEDPPAANDEAQQVQQVEQLQQLQQVPLNNVIVVKSAQGGQPIRRWYKAWKSAEGVAPESTGDLYDKLMGLVNPAIEGKKPKTITFVWMQGERDAREKHGSVYAASFAGLVKQLRADMKRKDISFVIGRLSDFGKYPDWEVVRKAQVEVAEDDPLGAWVDTDDLNGPKDGLHYDREGYVELGSRFAKAAIALINGEEK